MKNYNAQQCSLTNFTPRRVSKKSPPSPYKAQQKKERQGKTSQKSPCGNSDGRNSFRPARKKISEKPKKKEEAANKGAYKNAVRAQKSVRVTNALCSPSPFLRLGVSSPARARAARVLYFVHRITERERTRGSPALVFARLLPPYLPEPTPLHSFHFIRRPLYTRAGEGG